MFAMHTLCCVVQEEFLLGQCWNGAITPHLAPTKLDRSTIDCYATILQGLLLLTKYLLDCLLKIHDAK